MIIKKTTIRLPEELHKKLRIKAAKENKSMTVLIRKAVENMYFND